MTSRVHRRTLSSATASTTDRRAATPTRSTPASSACRAATATALSMGAWVLDYVSAWAGDRGFVRHSAVQYRFPAFDGDLTVLDAEVTDARYDRVLGAGLVTLEVTMTNQDGSVMAKGPVEVELPA